MSNIETSDNAPTIRSLEDELVNARRAIEDLLAERDFVTGRLEQAEEQRDTWCASHDAKRDELNIALEENTVLENRLYHVDTKAAKHKKLCAELEVQRDAARADFNGERSVLKATRGQLDMQHDRVQELKSDVAVLEGAADEAINDRDTWIDQFNTLNSHLTVANERIRELEPTELGKRLTELTEQRDAAVALVEERRQKHIDNMVELGEAAEEDLADYKSELKLEFDEAHDRMKEQLDKRSLRCAELETGIASAEDSHTGLLRQIDSLHDAIEDVRVARDAEYTFTPNGFVEKNAELHRTVNTQRDEIHTMRQTLTEQNRAIELLEDSDVDKLTNELRDALLKVGHLEVTADEAIEDRDMWIAKHADAESKSVRTQQELNATWSTFLTEQTNHDASRAALEVSEKVLQDAIDGKNNLCIQLFNVMKTATGRDYIKDSMIEDVAAVRAGYLRCAHLVRQGFNAMQGYTAADGGEVGRWRVEARDCTYAWEADGVTHGKGVPADLKEWPEAVTDIYAMLPLDLEADAKAYHAEVTETEGEKTKRLLVERDNLLGDVELPEDDI